MFSDDSDSDTEFEYMGNPNIKVRTVSFARDQAEEAKKEAAPKKSAKDAGSSSILSLLKKRTAKPPQPAAVNQDEEPIC